VKISEVICTQNLPCSSATGPSSRLVKTGEKLSLAFHTKNLCVQVNQEIFLLINNNICTRNMQLVVDAFWSSLCHGILIQFGRRSFE
jgi:hypothetical protein